LYMVSGNKIYEEIVITKPRWEILAIKYVRYTYKPSKINTLQQAERLGDQYRLLGRSSDNNEWSWKMLLEYQLLNPRT
jgi:phospholipid-translocating ATPase